MATYVFSIFSGVFASVSIVSDKCCKCFIQTLQK
jgi:hypothetical protein